MGGMNSDAIELLKEIRTLLESLDKRFAEQFPTWEECEESGKQLAKYLTETHNRQVGNKSVS